MKRINWYKPFLYILRSFVYLKRAFVFAWGYITRLFSWLDSVYRLTIGFYVYKSIFYIKKHVRKLSFSKKESRLEFFGRRGTLQFFMFLVVFTIMIPHSKLYTKEYSDIAGRNSLLYSILGPGDQDFSLEAVSLYTTVTADQVDQSWKQGALSIDPSTIDENKKKQTPQDLASVTAGGSALTKPLIMTGIDTHDFVDGAEPATTDRTAIVYYEVQSGDVIGQIAERFGISVQTILWSNNLTAKSYIRPGDQLAIMPVDGITHKVKSGDTVSKIARTYDADADEILSYNNITPTTVRIGETLLIPGGVKPQPVYSKPTYTTTRPTQFNNVVAPKPSVSVPAGTNYLWPTSATIITQYYGWRHGGLDIAGPVGTPLYATKAGTVAASACGWNWGYGCYVKLDHGGGVTSIYAHASQLYVSVGEYVSQGQAIAAMGSTGNSSGPHIHFEIQINGRRQNPLAYIRK